MIIVYGADWCEDTRRSLRHLRRLGVPYLYVNVDEDLDALARAQALNGGRRRTPTIDFGLGGAALVEPDNDTLTGALVEMDMLTAAAATARMNLQNVGDVERAARAVAGLLLLGAAATMPRAARRPAMAVGALAAATGLTGWCPFYHLARLSSLGGPGDRPHEAVRRGWLARRDRRAQTAPRGVEEPA